MSSLILLVDDNLDLVNTLAEGLTLTNQRYEVITAGGVDDAIAILQSRAVDLVVTDIRMPDKDGFDLLSYLLDHHPSMPTIVMTGYGTPELERRAEKLGSLRFLSKPLKIADLRREVDDVLAAVSSGALFEVVSASGFLQLLAMERSTCMVRIIAAEGAASLTFVDGEIAAARTGTGIEGEEAVLSLLDWTAPRLQVDKMSQTPPTNGPRLQVHGLLLEAARRRDERAHGEDASDGDHDPDSGESFQPAEEQPMQTSLTMPASPTKISSALEALRDDLGEGLTAVDIWSTKEAVSLGGIKSNPAATALMDRIGNMIDAALQEAEFPELKDFFLLNLADGNIVLVAAAGNYRSGALIDTEKASLGMLLSVAAPRLIENLANLDE